MQWQFFFSLLQGDYMQYFTVHFEDTFAFELFKTSEKYI